ncbi:MAG: glutamate--tRNA ligase, partial [Acidimicrobiales bacterium]
WAPSEGGPTWPPERFDEPRFVQIAPLVQERVTVLGDVPGMVDFLFLERPALDEQGWARVAADPLSGRTLTNAIETYGECEWTRDGIEVATRSVVESVGKNLSKGQAPIRVAVTGRAVGPPLFESLELLGREEVVARVRAALDRLDAS